MVRETQRTGRPMTALEAGGLILAGEFGLVAWAMLYLALRRDKAAVQTIAINDDGPGVQGAARPSTVLAAEAVASRDDSRGDGRDLCADTDDAGAPACVAEPRLPDPAPSGANRSAAEASPPGDGSGANDGSPSVASFKPRGDGVAELVIDESGGQCFELAD